jgi:succinate--hydroxymethylglutarate CoA-transferase
MDGMKPPLDGIRVLDFSRVIAGPLCTQHLADLGSEVIKVESIEDGEVGSGIDDTAVPGRNPLFLAFNRSKKSIALDLKAEGGPELALSLALRCDVLVENFRPGVMKRFGLDPETVRAAHPKLIYVSISAFGADGSMSDRPGLDPVLQAESGMMALTGAEGGPPIRTPLSMIDTLTASNAFGAICAALIGRERSGRGDFIDLSLMDTAYAALGNIGLGYLSTGKVPRRAGSGHVQSTPSDLFATKTDSIYIAVATDRLFRTFCCDVLEQPNLADDPRFSSGAARLQHRSELHALIEPVIKKHPAAYWLEQMRHLPVGVVRTIDVALEAPEAQERNMVRTIQNKDGKEIRLLGSPLKLTDTPMADFTAPPIHGADTDDVLRDVLGYPVDKIAVLRAHAIIK